MRKQQEVKSPLDVTQYFFQNTRSVAAEIRNF